MHKIVSIAHHNLRTTAQRKKHEKNGYHRNTIMELFTRVHIFFKMQ